MIQCFKETKVEKCPFCRVVLQARIQDGLADAGEIFEDITQVTGREFGDDIDGYLAGFPCQARSTSAVSVTICGFFPCPGCEHGRRPNVDAGDKDSINQTCLQIVGRKRNYGQTNEP